MLNSLAHQLLKQLPGNTNSLCVAFSGGLDSRFLLHLAYTACQLAKQQPQAYPALSLRAVHVHHGFSANANAWASFCQDCCNQLGIQLAIHKVEPNKLAGASLEDRARRARYGVFEAELQTNEVLLQGHHQNDQAETLLLNLMRGSGSLGLSGIPASRPLAKGFILRPLLNTPRAKLEELALAAGLTWVEDESNQENIYDRNFLRLDVLPLLASRFPSSLANLAKSSQLAATSQQLNNDLAALDLANCQLTNNSLSLTGLAALADYRQINLLRFWLSQRGLTLPGHKAWPQIFQLIEAKQDAQPLVSWASRSLSVNAPKEFIDARRFNNQLFIAPASFFQPLPKNWQTTWQGQAPLITPAGEFNFSLSSKKLTATHQEFSVTSRQGGEVIELENRGKRDVKRLLQEANLPPWQRNQQPFIWQGKQLIAVGQLLVAKGYQLTQE